MLKAIRDIGELYGKIEIYDPIEAEKVLILEFNKDGKFTKVDLEDFSKDKLSLYIRWVRNSL